MAECILAKRLKLSLDELRMQTLGAQVLLGFQMQCLFQPSFQHASLEERLADSVSLAAILLSLTSLLVPPSQHRLAESGEASFRLLRISDHSAEFALATMAIALGSIAFSISRHVGIEHPAVIGICVGMLASFVWFGVGNLLKRPSHTRLPEHEPVDLHTKIDQMLTEARVVLPGVQAMLGFQLIVVMTEAFQRLPSTYRDLHLVGLALTILCVALLLAPAAIHRLGFSGEDDACFHAIGSRFVSSALTPLALAMAFEVTIAAWKLSENATAAFAAGSSALMVLLGAWYAIPLIAKRQAVRRLE
ncbi:MAG: hypothetical protein JSR66_17145 [Proteobacteria bacterium]|nr:hypothetical protein [Pseudomonadota bacterium]